MPESQRQVRHAHAVLSGSARKGSMSREVAREIVEEMHGRRMSDLPKRKRRKNR